MSPKNFLNCLIRDRHALRRLARTCAGDKSTAELQQQLSAREEQSKALVAQRRAAIPKIQFPTELPIIERLDEIRQAIADNQVIVLCGETGSGKSTQLPKICLSLGLGVYGRIGHTQPRRIAARSLASRVANELQQQVGQSVGYKVRFADHVAETTHIKLMTDGILLAEIQRDPYLNDYEVLIIDEAHERSLNIDFLLGYLHQLLPKRPDLKVIITSATIDPERFSNHFGQAPIIEVSGRTYPVEVRYMPPPEDEDTGGMDMQQGIVNAVDELSQLGRGDILIFFSGEREIREAAETLRKHKLAATEVLPLYARQSPAEQSKLFQPGNARRIVLATNVAETSLTVPGIRYVIDTGYARISRYSARSKIQRLPIEAISQASANQRKGRCGRVAAGVCIRLYSEEDFLLRSEFTEPEILRTNLASVILQMQALGFGDIEAFPFVEPPDNRMIKDGYRVLHELGAVDGVYRITKLGRKLARLPIDPRVGRMLLEAAHGGALRELLVIGAALSVQDPRERPMDKQQVADEAHAMFVDEQSDFLTLLKLWDFLQEKRGHLTRRKFDRLCREHFLAPIRIREWMDIQQQLKQQMHELKYRDNSKPASYEVIHMAILSGLLSHVGLRNTGKERGYLGARNSKFHIFPGSGQFKREPKWVVAAELVETTRLYARGVAQVQPEWIEKLSGHLLKHSYSEPHWQAKAGRVAAYEKATLYGLPIVTRRRVNYGPIDPATSHDIFLRFGLVEGEVRTRAPFWRHNQELIADLHAQEAKARRRDLLVDEEAIYQFYAQRVPQAIYSTAQLETWLRKQKNQKILHMLVQDVQKNTTGFGQAQFPDHLMLNGARLPLRYHFEPGSEQDGVTLRVPLPLLNQLSVGQVDWLVPGLIEEKVIAMLKGLPKQYRRQFVPVPDYAKRCLDIMGISEAPLHQTLAATLKQVSGVHIPEDVWHSNPLDPYLQMRVCVCSVDGKQTLACSRDLLQLQHDYADAVVNGPAITSTSHELEQQGLKDWTFAELPESVEIQANGMQLRAFPALVDEGDSVAIRCVDSQARAELLHRAGLRRLFMLRQAKTVRDLRKQNADIQSMRLHYAKVPALKNDKSAKQKIELEDQLLVLAFDQAFLAKGIDIRTPQAFEQCYDQGRAKLFETYQSILCLVKTALATYHAVRKQLGNMNHISLLSSVQDVQQHLDSLVYQGFLQSVPAAQLQQYERYLRTIELRLDKLKSGNQNRDQQAMHQLDEIWQRWQQRDQQARSKGQVDPRLQQVRWQLEELRISLFAQEVKTLYPVSVKRIDKLWRELGL
jgi:ATP-dependent helicase HrpA